MLPTHHANRRFRNQKTERKRTPTRKLVGFEVNREIYAIPIERVQRVLNQFTPQGVLESGRSLVKFDDEVITLLDLARLFVPSVSEKTDGEYLIVCLLSNGDRLGIPIPNLPTVMDIPEDKFESVPASYREGTQSSIQAPEALEKLIYTESGAIAFYLNVDRLLPAV